MTYLIIGFSAAGANAADLIRRSDPKAQVTVLSADERQFYLRLDLEKILRGKTAEAISPRSSAFWREKCVEIVTARVSQICPKRKSVETSTGQILKYDRLLIATGANPRHLDIPGKTLAEVTTYYALNDAERIYAERNRIRNAVIIGGGILGLELAHSAADFGWSITLLVRGGHVGSPIVDPSGSRLISESLARTGINVIYDDEAVEFVGESGSLRAVRTKQGQEIPADLSAVCIGVEPSVAFLEHSGLLTDGKLIVDSHLRTSDPDIFAAGDVALVRVADDRLIPCHNWSVAQSQARIAAANMTGQNQVWNEDVLNNLDNLFDREFVMIGRWSDRHERHRTIQEFDGSDDYRAIVTRAGILESALLLGSRTGDRLIRTLITKQANVEGKTERLFDPDARPEEFLSAHEV